MLQNTKEPKNLEYKGVENAQNLILDTDGFCIDDCEKDFTRITDVIIFCHGSICPNEKQKMFPLSED